MGHNMLRKQKRERIVDGSYNKRSVARDEELPDWYVYVCVCVCVVCMCGMYVWYVCVVCMCVCVCSMNVWYVCVWCSMYVVCVNECTCARVSIYMCHIQHTQVRRR
jgi:hypothetical protein